VLQLQEEALHAAIASRQIRRQIAGHALQRKNQRGDVFHFMRKLDDPVDRIGRHVQIEPGRPIPDQAIHRLQQFRTEAALQTITRHAEQLPQTAHAHARERIDRLRRQAALAQRYLVEQAPQALMAECCLPIAHACQDVGAIRRRRSGDAIAKTQCRKIVA
jgi:hypothetical protein